MRRLTRDFTGTGERASAAVEFALVLPLVLTMTLALLQVGLLAKDELVVGESARAGARQASVSTDDDSVRRSVENAAVGLGPDRLDVSLQREGGVGTPAEVTVVYHAPVTVPIVSWLFPSTIDISSSAVMRQETE